MAGVYYDLRRHHRTGSEGHSWWVRGSDSVTHPSPLHTHTPLFSPPLTHTHKGCLGSLVPLSPTQIYTQRVIVALSSHTHRYPSCMSGPSYPHTQDVKAFRGTTCTLDVRVCVMGRSSAW